MTRIRDLQRQVAQTQKVVSDLMDELDDGLLTITADERLTESGKADRARLLGREFAEKLEAAQARELDAIEALREGVDRAALSTPGTVADPLDEKPQRRNYLKPSGELDAQRYHQALADWRTGLTEATYRLQAVRAKVEELDRLPSAVLAQWAGRASTTTLEALREVAVRRASTAPPINGDPSGLDLLKQDMPASLLVERSFGALLNPAEMEPGVWELVRSVAAREAQELTGDQADARAAIAEGTVNVKPLGLAFTDPTFAGAFHEGLAEGGGEDAAE